MKNRIFNLLKCCNTIVHKRSHRELIMAMRTELAELFGFEYCGIFLYDPLSKSNNIFGKYLFEM